jgi:arylsulfatase A-like enzyme
VKADLEAYFECLVGMDHNLNRILDTMEELNVLNNTLIIFISDNGFFFGEHQFSGKLWPYEESIRVPIFLRYPAWFSPGTVITEQLATNADIAPTILDAAGISNQYGMDGFSLHDLYTGSKKRDAFLIESIQTANDKTPGFPIDPYQSL